MDLIYANRAGEDIGVIKAFNFDLAYGDSENNFELEVMSQDYDMAYGYLVYIDDTEYGGIIDKVNASAFDDIITVKGRTWHGILEGQILFPEYGVPLTVSGYGHDVLRQIIKRLGLDDLFEVSTEFTPLYIPSYTFNDIVGAYTGICQMLARYKYKLKMKHRNDKVILSVEKVYNYSTDEEWESYQFQMEVEKNYRPVNHLVCVGKSDNGNQTIIHLFTDENGFVQPYKIVDIPYSDAYYIRDERNKILIGKDEVSAMFESNVSVINSYYPAPKMDSFEDWKRLIDLGEILKKEINEETGNVSYKVVEADVEEHKDYSKVTTKPLDWDVSYGSYVTLSGGEAVQIEPVIEESYVVFAKEPNDWATNYASYYYSVVGSGTFQPVQAEQEYYYAPLSRIPIDWNENYSSYYEYKTNSYVSAQSDGGKVPSFYKKSYYKRETVNVPPKFSYNTEGKIFAYKNVRTLAPDFDTISGAGGVYSVSLYESKIYPYWIADTYFKVYVDNYSKLAEAGVEKLKEYWKTDVIDIDFNSNYKNDYDIGDIVGANELVTGISVSSEIGKKIVTIKDGDVKVNYQIKKG